MSECTHDTLVLVETPARKRCRHCHLTLTAAELGDGPCPECQETFGEERYDFEPVEQDETPTYVCDGCGAPIG